MNKITFITILSLTFLTGSVFADSQLARKDVISSELDAFEKQFAQSTNHAQFAAASDLKFKDGYYEVDAIHVPSKQTPKVAVKEPQPISQTQPILEEKKYQYTPPTSPTPKQESVKPILLKEKGSSPVKGELRLGIGATSEDFIWNEANYDLNELNFRTLSRDQLNNQENTFDPGIYDRLQFDVDVKDSKFPVSFHTKIAIDPWSFTGKTAKTTISSTSGDTAEIELLYWSNSGYTVNQIFSSLRDGDSFAMSELKIVDGHTVATTASGSFDPFPNTFNIPALEIEHTFQPIREFWVDYEPNETTKVRVAPMAFEDFALTSDDPMHISNNRMYWEESPWITQWKPGVYNPTAGTFKKGFFDDSLAFFTRDSNGQRLTALRGVSIESELTDSLSFKGTAATPKDLWQEYDSFDSIPASFRLKNFINDEFYVGTTTTAHLGFNDDSLDAYNYVGSVDTGFAINDYVKMEAQVSHSESRQDLTRNDFETDSRGAAYYVSMIATSLDEPILQKDYFALRPNANHQEQNFLTTRIFFAAMEDDFEASLSSYRETRDDSFWSRHLHFRRPMDSFFGDGGVGWYDIEPYAIGNGIDIGRNVVGFRTEGAYFNGTLRGLVDVRHVTSNADNSFIENVARTELTHKTTDRLTTKLIYLRHDLPGTTAGFDPFLINPQNDNFLRNSIITDDLDASLDTFSLGAQYELTQWADINGVWEHTNDVTAASDNFPRGLFNSTYTGTYVENGKTFFESVAQLYSQGNFELPPYDHIDIFKMGLNLRPTDKWDVYLDFTKNPNKWAGQIDDNMNHFGIETTYRPYQKLGLFFKYTYSQWNDLNRLLNDSEVVYEDHHNFYSALRYAFSDNENLTFLYGVGPSPNVSTSTFDPFGGSLATLDTQHIFRLFFQKRF